MTPEQKAKLVDLCQRYNVDFNESDYAPAFDLPSGWVAGWVGGVQTTLYVGVSPEGEASS